MLSYQQTTALDQLTTRNDVLTRMAERFEMIATDMHAPQTQTIFHNETELTARAAAA